MRKFAMVLAAVVLMAGLALALAVRSLNRIITTNREVILARVQRAIGRPLAVESISVHWRGGLGVVLNQIEIGEDPDFGRDPFVQAPKLTAYLKLAPLLARRLEVGSITLATPVIRVVQDANGHRNFESLGPAALHASRESPILRVAAADDVGGAAAVPASLPFALVIDSLRVRDGTLVSIDRAQSPPVTTTLEHIDVTLRDVSIDRPIRFTFAAALANTASNLALAGEVGPWTQRERLPLHARGTLGPFNELRAVVDGLELNAVLTPSTVELQQASGNAFAGTFAASGSYALSRGGPAHLVGKLQNIDMSQLLALRNETAAVPLEGRGSLRFDLRGPAGADLSRVMSGTVAAEVTQGVLRQFNVLREVVDHVSTIPALGQRLAARIKPKYGQRLSAVDTRFERISATLQVADGRATTNDLTLTAEDFGVRAVGWLSVDRDIDMTGTLLLSKGVSDDIVADLKDARFILDEHGQFAFPFRLRGKLGHAKPEADVDGLQRLFERALSRGAAGELLDKLLKGKHPREKKTPESDSLQRGLRNLFDH